MYAVFRKELADHINSSRFIILFALALLAAIFALYVATQNIRGEVTAETEFIFLKLFTTSGERLPSFLFFISLFIPIIAIALGFDAISSERVSGNLSRLLSQPIYRDAVINGKFLAGLAVLAIIIASLIAIVAGMGLRIIGVPPNSEEVFRLIVFALISVIYGAFWMALAVLFSVFFNRAASAMLASIGLWIFFFFFMPIIAGVIGNIGVAAAVARISPCTLYGQTTIVLLMPGLDPTTALILQQFTGRMPTPLPFGQSLLLVWPQLVTVIALAAICFAVSYIRFMREEIRAT